MKKTLLVLLVTTSGITTQAARGGGEFVFEPSLGYKEETLKLTDYSENATQINMKGALGGLKIGVQSSAGVSLLLAGEYLTGKAKIDPVTNDEPKFKHTIAGFQVGVTAMNAMKIYLGYAPLNKLEFSYENSVNDFSLTGQTYQAGLMFYPFQYVGLGVQYNIHQFKEVEGDIFTLGKDTKTYYDKIDSKDLSFTFSIML